MKILIATSSRADFGLLSNLIKDLKKDKIFKVSCLVTGSHFSKTHGSSYKDILKKKIKINDKIFLKNFSFTPKDTLQDIRIILKNASQIFLKNKPEKVLVLGDRYEIFGIAICAYFFRIPIIHIHGGELTNGSLDNDIRHSITKLSNIHFVANKVYQKRVIQLGENPKNIFVVGGLGVDNIKRSKILKKSELLKKLKINIKKKFVLVNFQPEINKKDTIKLVSETLISLKKLKDTTLLFTAPGMDLHNREIFLLIKRFKKNNKNSYFFENLGSELFYSCMKHSNFMIGNSSSGILEMPSFKKGTINIGDRQSGRLKALSVIDVQPNNKKITKKIDFLFSEKFKKKLKYTKNLYGKSGAIKKIISHLKKIKNKKLVKKNFYDIKF